jgi:hypothetical protein
MSVLVLLRHGESAWNAADVFTGWIEVGLSDSKHGTPGRSSPPTAASPRWCTPPFSAGPSGPRTWHLPPPDGHGFPCGGPGD